MSRKQFHTEFWFGISRFSALDEVLIVSIWPVVERRQASPTVDLWNSAAAEQAGPPNIKPNVRILLEFHLVSTARSPGDQSVCDDNNVNLAAPRPDGKEEPTNHTTYQGTVAHSVCTRAKQSQHHKKVAPPTRVVLREGAAYCKRFSKPVLLSYSLHLTAILTVILPPWLTHSGTHASDPHRSSGANAWLAQTLRGGNPTYYMRRYRAFIILDVLPYLPSISGTLSRDTSLSPRSFLGAHMRFLAQAVGEL